MEQIVWKMIFLDSWRFSLMEISHSFFGVYLYLNEKSMDFFRAHLLELPEPLSQLRMDSKYVAALEHGEETQRKMALQK